MRRSTRPTLELLEGKALLSMASVATSGLHDTLTAVVRKTASGVQVVATLTETNVSNHSISIAHGPSNEGFVVSQAGKSVWLSNGSGVASPDFVILDVLKPHQSFKISTTWDGHANLVDSLDHSQDGPPISGSVTISNELDHGTATARIIVPKVAPPKPPGPHR
jgi:hypothetical protein